MRKLNFKTEKVIIAGGRDFNNYDYLVTSMESVMASGLLKSNRLTIVSGRAQGADLLGERFAEDFGFFTELYPAKWKDLGRQAGFRRNEKMLEVADALVAFWDGCSHGTGHMIEIARRKGIPVWVFPYDGELCQQQAADVAHVKAIEKEWQKKQTEERKKLAEKEGKEFSFKEANDIELDCLKSDGYFSEREEPDEIVEHFQEWWSHGMSTEEWRTLQQMTNREKRHEWRMFAPWAHGDYDFEEIFPLLKFKLERMIAYWKQFSHCHNGEYIRRQMETACRLLQIIIKQGNESDDCDSFPYYVNMRNATRFSVNHCGHCFFGREQQEVRYKKAFCILFKYLAQNIHRWWD